jgi:NADPH:quinone reductase-like Zn-dependent oxidoreductase
MVIRLAASRGVEVVNVVRRREQVELLKAAGAREVLDSSEENFDERLAEVCKRVRATVAFDAVAGKLTGRVLHAMPSGSECVVYGGLSMEGCLLDPRSLIFERKRVRGFWLSDWMRTAGALKMFSASRSVQKILKNELRTEIRARLPLEQAAEGVRLYEREMTGGKILFVPGIKS